MVLTDMAAAFWRRWYLSLLALALCAGAGWWAWGAVGTSYEASSSVVLLPPRTTTHPGAKGESPGNPLLFLGGLGQSRDILVDQLSDDESARAVADQLGPQVSYEVVPDVESSGPLLVITGHAPTPAQALETVKVVRDRVPGTLDALQDDLGIPALARLSTLPVVADAKATPLHKDQARAMLLAVGGPAVLFTLLIGLLDSLLRTRAARQDSEPPEATGTAVVHVPPPTPLARPVRVGVARERLGHRPAAR